MEAALQQRCRQLLPELPLVFDDRRQLSAVLLVSPALPILLFQLFERGYPRACFVHPHHHRVILLVHSLPLSLGAEVAIEVLFAAGELLLWVYRLPCISLDQFR